MSLPISDNNHDPLFNLFLVSMYIINKQFQTDSNGNNLPVRRLHCLPRWSSHVKRHIEHVQYGRHGIGYRMFKWFGEAIIFGFREHGYTENYDQTFFPEYNITPRNLWVSFIQVMYINSSKLAQIHSFGYSTIIKYRWIWEKMDIIRTALRSPPKNMERTPRSLCLGDRSTLYSFLYVLFDFLHQIKNIFLSQTRCVVMTTGETNLVFLLLHQREWENVVAWSATYWLDMEYLIYLKNYDGQTIIVVNDRWGKGIPCHHGSFYNCKDRYNPGVLQAHKWENAMTLDKKSWGYRRAALATDYLTIEEILKTVAMTISCGGNILINVGPTKDGRIPPIMEERLRQMGTWLNINGEAIYESQPWTHQNDSLTKDVWYTQKGSSVYAIVLNWPPGGVLTLSSAVGTTATRITMFGYSHDLPPMQHKMMRKGLQVVFPPMSQVSSQWAWVLAMENIKPAKLAARKPLPVVPIIPSPNHIWNYNPF
ncbi:unnamed protein product, partial [Meganyctiphanes norvegica]